MRRQHHYYGANHLHYLTANICRRARIFDSDRFKLKFTETLDQLRGELGFKIIGYVLMTHHRVWQRGGYDLNIWSEKKRREKLTYLHNNPVKRGLVLQPGDWPWSS